MAAVGSESTGFIESLADVCGSSAPALRLLISVLLGYPLAFLYRHLIFQRSASEQHLYFTLSGILLCYFNYGFDVLHIVGSILVLYILLLTQGGSRLSVGVALTYFMGYLLLGYYYTETDGYDIKWTMPYCVFTLKAISVVFDVYDGKKEKHKLGSDQKYNALSQIPSLLEISGYSFFYGTCLVGPQMPFNRYLNFVEKKSSFPNSEPNSVGPGVYRGAAGILYLVFFLVGNAYFPFDYIYSDDYKNKAFISKFFIMGIWGKVIYTKYLISWILSEGSCIITGLTYNGKDEMGEDRWDGCANVNLIRFETATKFGHLIDGFNITTNKWVATYIYKRMRFLGNKLVSQAAALAFLAVWHGLHFTYYLTFFLEFTVMKLEHDVEGIVSRSPRLSSILRSPNTAVKITKYILLKLYVLVFFSYCIVPFAVIKWDLANQAFSEVYYIGHVLYFGWLFAYPLYKYLTKKSRKVESTHQNGVETNKNK